MKGELVVTRSTAGRRVALHLEGQPVSWADLLYRRLRIGRATLTFGGIAGVGTHHPHRKRGYSRRVLQQCLKVMTDDGLDVSMLFGIPGYYDRFGYRTTLSEYEFTIAGRELVKLGQRLKARRLRPGEHAATLTLYRRSMPDRALATERRKHSWSRFKSGSNWNIPAEVTGIYEGHRLAGYVVCDDVPNAVRVSELVATSPDALSSALAWLGRQCRRKVVEKAVFYLPPDHPAAAVAVELGATFTQQTFHNGGGMMRILNLDSTLAALEEELTARWQASGFGDRRLVLTFQTDLGRSELSLPGSRRLSPPVRGRIRIGQERFIQLITGYVGAAAMSQKPEVRIPGKLTGPLTVLFPEQHAHILRTNHF